jgi:hypothetical protein
MSMLDKATMTRRASSLSLQECLALLFAKHSYAKAGFQLVHRNNESLDRCSVKQLVHRGEKFHFSTYFFRLILDSFEVTVAMILFCGLESIPGRIFAVAKMWQVASQASASYELNQLNAVRHFFCPKSCQ